MHITHLLPYPRKYNYESGEYRREYNEYRNQLYIASDGGPIAITVKRRSTVAPKSVEPSPHLAPLEGIINKI